MSETRGGSKPTRTSKNATTAGRGDRTSRAADDPAAPGNHVLLRGRVSTPPEPRELPSGSVVVSLRMSVGRETTPMTKGSRQAVDWVDCSAWGAAQRRSVASWREGDVVEVEGALRRRTSRGPQGLRTRLEVEVLKARMVQRAPERTTPVL